MGGEAIHGQPFQKGGRGWQHVKRTVQGWPGTLIPMQYSSTLELNCSIPPRTAGTDSALYNPTTVGHITCFLG